jgi:molybdopterin converting factor subunit 1
MRDTPASTVVSVRVVYLARLREAFGFSGETIEAAGGETPTVDTIVAALHARGGVWATELAAGRAVRFAVNHRLATREHPLSDGDELAVFPPVTGG